MTMIVPGWRVERSLQREGYPRVAGVDEVGRGPLAGPVVAAAVVVPPTRAAWVRRVRDSKLLPPEAREELAAIIRERCEWGLGIVSTQVVDQINILQATRLAMRRAVEALPCAPDVLLIDGREVLDCRLPQRAVIDADATCVSVAAASIVAKVARDAMMRDLDKIFPGYGLAQNKGYASPDHREALQRLGYSNIHRLSFAPVRAAVLP